MIDNRPPFKRFIKDNPYEIFKGIKTPFYAIDKKGLKYNGEILKSIQEDTGCKILLAQKCFSNFNLYNTLKQYLAGTEASGLFEARLGYEEMPGKEVHVYCGAYRDDEFDEIIKYSDHIVFNSVSQLKRFGPKAKAAQKSIGVRLNPEHSTQNGPEIYDPCSSGSRLGITIDQFIREMDDETLSLLDGVHFHTLCQQNSDALYETLLEVDKKYGKYFSNLKWINFGGGHHITRADYDITLLKKCIKYAQDKWNLEVYLEPGEAVVLDAGYLVTTVLDTFTSNNQRFAMLDTSAACHMPDVVEMPYLPPLYQTDLEGYNINIRLGGPTCLAGDTIGNYNFRNEINSGDMLIFGDMALYTTCKNNTFNGMPLPNIYILEDNNSLTKLTNFGYNDFKYRLGKIK